MNIDKALGNGCFNITKQITIDSAGNYFCILPETCKHCKIWEFCTKAGIAIERYYNHKSKIRETVK